MDGDRLCLPDSRGKERVMEREADADATLPSLPSLIPSASQVGSDGMRWWKRKRERELSAPEIPSPVMMSLDSGNGAATPAGARDPAVVKGSKPQRRNRYLVLLCGTSLPFCFRFGSHEC